MLLNGVDHFEMKLDSPLQLILGTNGSGKSSLLWELSPVPGSASDFTPGGRKVIELEHQGRHYILTSTFSGKQEHSFIMESEELNQGGTITVQKELVKEHFKITNEIQELVSGRETFDAMSTARRKEWFLRLCDVNYDYALGIYGQLKAAHRDRSGAIRLEKKALVVESEKLLQDDEVARISQETKALHECLSQLLEHRKPVESDLTLMSIENDRLDKALISLTHQFSDLNNKINSREHSDAELVDLIDETNAQIVSFSTQISMLAGQHEKAAQKISVLQRTGENTLASLESDLIAIKDQIAQESSKSFLNAAIEAPESAYAAFSSIKASLSSIFSDIPNNGKKQYSQAALQKGREELAALTKLKDNQLESISEKKASLSHMRDHMGKPDATCPKCQHSFSLVYSEERLFALTQAVAILEEKLQSEIYPKIAELELYIEQCAQYGLLFRQFHQLQSGSPLLKAYWDYLAEKKTLSNSPEQGVMELEKIEQDLLLQVKMQETLKKSVLITENLELLKSVGDTNLNELVEQNAQIEQDLADKTQQLQTVQAQNTHYKNQFALRREALNLRKSIHKTILAKRTLLTEETEHNRRSIFNQLIRDLQSALASREYALSAANHQRQLVQEMALKIERLSQEENALAILVKELSPTEGLIAEGILGFIKNFCDQMNEFIQRVWSYPLMVKSCEVVDGDSLDLDYRFPLVVGDAENTVSDVAKGSTGMHEIVNLAFRLTALPYLGLEDSGLYLDEFGASFDKDHRTAASLMIRNLIEQQTFPQVLAVSHYQDVYGVFTDAQVCVLNDTNILVPKNFNEHVIVY